MMTHVELIRAATRGAAYSNLNKLLLIAYEGDDAHHYLAQTMTDGLREALVNHLSRLCEPVGDVGGVLRNYETWRINLPTACEPHITMALTSWQALHLWKRFMLRVTLALGWVFCRGNWDYPEDLQDQLDHLLYTVQWCDVEEAQKALRRVRMDLLPLGATPLMSGRELHRVFAEAFLDVWLTGAWPAEFNAQPWEV